METDLRLPELLETQKAAFGLNELLRNAVEHGNLGIRYDDKANLLRSGSWQEEVERRLSDNPPLIDPD